VTVGSRQGLESSERLGQPLEQPPLGRVGLVGRARASDPGDPSVARPLCVRSAPHSAELLKDRRRDSTLCARDACASQGLNQPVKEGRLRFLQFAPRFFQWKETGLIDFWKTLHLSRARRPLLSKLFEQT